MIDLKTVFSVSQLARHLNDHLRNEFGSIRIQGEVASFTRASSGHWYLALKDESAQLKAVMFRQRNVLAGFFPAVGDKVEVLAQLAMYEQRGELQLIIDVMKKAGQGNLHEQYLQLKTKLTQEGLFDSARKRPLPSVVFNLGVITSLQAAALADVKQALARRAPHVEYSVYHTAVQGEQAAAQIIEALRKAEREQRGKPSLDAINTLRYSPSRQQPFIIATSEPESLSRRYRWQSLAWLLGSLACIAGVAWLVQSGAVSMTAG